MHGGDKWEGKVTVVICMKTLSLHLSALGEVKYVNSQSD